jgi:hypothetical protein
LGWQPQLPQPHDGSQQSPQPQLASQPQPASQQSPQPQDASQQLGPVQPHIGMYDSQPQLYVRPANLRPSTQYAPQPQPHDGSEQQPASQPQLASQPQPPSIQRSGSQPSQQFGLPQPQGLLPMPRYSQRPTP